MTTENIVQDGQLWAMILRGGRVDPGVHFCTTDDNALQVGKQWRVKGTAIGAHAHHPVGVKNRESFLQEVLYIEQGKLKVIFYTDLGQRVDERVLATGDTILLIRGGHGFEVLEDTQILEIKMGPYDAAAKKTIQPKV
jgi:hypothetical protein